VVSVRLRGDQVVTGSYACRGAMSPRPERLVRTAQRPAATPFPGPPSATPNRYGPPRLDADGRRFIP
jgi:hypothetical protein